MSDFNNIKFNITRAYYHMVFTSKSGSDGVPDLQRDFGHMFVGEVLPKVGQEIRMVCTERSEAGDSHSIVINLQVVESGS